MSDAQDELEKFHHRQLARADRLASLGEMAAGIAHEIKNPLAGIYGAAQVLVDEFPEGDPKREIVGEMMVLLKRLDNTIRDLLNFARYTEPQFTKGNLNDVIDKVLFLVQQIPEGKRARIVREFDPGMPEIEMDQEQVKQVFLNLALNALQARPDGVTLTIRTRGDVPAEGGDGAAPRPLRDGVGVRRRPGDPAGQAGEDLPAVLHDEGERHGPRALDDPEDPRPARGKDHGGERGREAARPSPCSCRR